jgi:hypothetical protein
MSKFHSATTNNPNITLLPKTLEKLLLLVTYDNDRSQQVRDDLLHHVLRSPESHQLHGRDTKLPNSIVESV